MKVLYILLFLLAGLKPAISDSTLVFKSFSDKTSRSNSYYLKDNQLRLLEEHSELFNIYDKSNQSFTSLNTKTGKASRINSQVLQQRVELLNQQRLKELAVIEKDLRSRLKDMSDTEKKVGESLINQRKYPDLYGSHTLLNIHKTKLSKTINNINCDVYKILRKNTEIKTVCMATNHSLKLSDQDFDTLRHFHHFNYMAQTRIMLAMGKTDFEQIDYQQENIKGIPIEIINTSGKTEKLEMMLLNVSREKLDKALFIPPKP
jgi:hypothetical protein